MMRNDDYWMRLAIIVGQGNPSAPFGAVIVDSASNRECSRGVNQAHLDPTLHGEMVALRTFFNSSAPPQSGPLTLYTTAEPCPMCAAACCWARVHRIVYGVSIPWLAEHGWRQIELRAETLLRATSESIAVDGGVLANDCAELFVAAHRKPEDL
ncbi:MAG: nucleoside deaminase [Phycisphaerae bacterium]